MQEYRAVIDEIKKGHPENPYHIATIKCGYWGSMRCEAGGSEIAEMMFAEKKKTSNLKHVEPVELTVTAVDVQAIAGDGKVFFGPPFSTPPLFRL